MVLKSVLLQKNMHETKCHPHQNKGSFSKKNVKEWNLYI